MTDHYDAIVIGAGHNGLVCSAMLAKAGKQVLVLEANDQVGGAAVTREFADGFSVSACAHLLYQLQPAVQKELGIRPQLSADDLESIVLAEDSNHVRYRGSAVSGVSENDAESYRAFHERMSRYADLLQTYLNKTPPRFGTKNPKDLLTLAQIGIDFKRLGKVEMQEFLRLIGMNIHDELTERFDSPLLKGGLSLDAVLGTHLGPRSPNTFMTSLYRMAGSHARLALPTGGMGSVSDALAHSARAAGVTIRTGMPVKRIVVSDGSAVGVETASGETFESKTVVSNVDPKRTIMDLVGARNVETGFVRRISNFRCRGNAAKLHLALDALPQVDGLQEKDFANRLLIAVDEHYVERSFNPAKYGKASPEPVMEITFPSYRDESLAPPGKHVMSAIVQYAPYELKGGWSDAAKHAVVDTCIKTVSRYAPDIESLVTARELLTPADIEEQFNITGGHWHHGELTLDQFWFVRPVCSSAQYAMPIDGLYLCGAGAHPGGGVSGAAGRNAAKTILREDKAA